MRMRRQRDQVGDIPTLDISQIIGRKALQPSRQIIWQQCRKGFVMDNMLRCQGAVARQLGDQGNFA